MTRIRAEFDADMAPKKQPSSFETEENRFPIPCSVCGKDFYFDLETKNEIARVWKASGENPFVCDDCEADLEEAAFRNTTP
ncbi:MAG: hypothetical protein C4325_03150 [Blastocatellia bacterium]